MDRVPLRLGGQRSPKAGFMGPTTLAIVNALREGKALDGVGVVGTFKRKLPTLGTTNGAAMRVAPAGLIDPGDVVGACNTALVTCLRSHDTDVAIASACAVAAGVAVAMRGAIFEEVVKAFIQGGQPDTACGGPCTRSPGPRFSTRLKMALRSLGEPIATGASSPSRSRNRLRRAGLLIRSRRDRDLRLCQGRSAADGCALCECRRRHGHTRHDGRRNERGYGWRRGPAAVARHGVPCGQRS